MPLGALGSSPARLHLEGSVQNKVPRHLGPSGRQVVRLRLAVLVSNPASLYLAALHSQVVRYLEGWGSSLAVCSAHTNQQQVSSGDYGRKLILMYP